MTSNLNHTGESPHPGRVEVEGMGFVYLSFGHFVLIVNYNKGDFKKVFKYFNILVCWRSDGEQLF